MAGVIQTGIDFGYNQSKTTAAAIFQDGTILFLDENDVKKAKAMMERKTQELTWNELKNYDEKPVWVEIYSDIPEREGWTLISYFDFSAFHDDDYCCFLFPDGSESIQYKGLIGRTWKAFRKEQW